MRATTIASVALLTGVFLACGMALHARPIDARAVAPQALNYRININRAGAAALAVLPGVGPTLAQRIIDRRAATGEFHSIDDVRQAPGIGPRTAAQLEAFIRYD